MRRAGAVLLTRTGAAVVVLVLFVAVGTGATVSAVGASVGLRVPDGAGARVRLAGLRVGLVGVIGLRVGTIIMLVGADGIGMIGVGLTGGQWCGPDLLDPPFPLPFPFLDLPFLLLLLALESA